jgi:hypothetical protein
LAIDAPILVHLTEKQYQNQTIVFLEVIVYFETQYGAVAQLGERFVRNEEVVSSILISSTGVWFQRKDTRKL